MSEILEVTLLASGGAVVGSVVTALIYTYANRKNSLASALNNAANALNIANDELVESMLGAKKLRDENKKKDEVLEKLRVDYKQLKGITRKMYIVMEKSYIDAHLSEDELSMLFDTQDLISYREKNIP
jgi:hypothetical protein